MGKIIAVCGSPGSGKTTASLKIAEEIYYAKNGSVIFLSPDLNVPCLAFVFPNCKEEELYSVGVAMDRTDIYREDVLRQMNYVKSMENFGFLGYKAGENKYSYPRPTEDKILNLFSILKELAIIVLACVIFSVFASSPPTVDTSAAAVTQVWSYVGELIFNMLVLVGSIKMADRIVREMMGL